MPLRWCLILALFVSPTGWSAEIYTFGKRGDGTRYIKNIDRAPRKAEESAKGSANKTPPPPRPAGNFRPSRQAIPPPIPDAQKLELLDRPI